ncbi:hypothetical protein SAMN05216202_1784 [Pseudomonas mucidolens]|uniref:Uncharacterized protein n=1 Tax=Pseudomonas mucidolens TaxID=46679 RepID=A0A1H2MIN4_9PSED|nr:hypothetical protein SAMN05216202_1784 [Pseudomonas mucidolens]SQH33806.1 Uncharacterised protein [Pseudomonas mucidolens]
MSSRNWACTSLPNASNPTTNEALLYGQQSLLISSDFTETPARPGTPRERQAGIYIPPAWDRDDDTFIVVILTAMSFTKRTSYDFALPS